MKKNLQIHMLTSQGNVEYNLLGEYDVERNIIHYVDSDEQTQMTLDLNHHKLIRENDNLRIECLFLEKETTTQKILLKENKQILEVPIQTKQFMVDNQEIKIEYVVDNQDIIIYEIKM